MPPLRSAALRHRATIPRRREPDTYDTLVRLLGPRTPVPPPAPRADAERLVTLMTAESTSVPVSRRAWGHDRLVAMCATLHHLSELLGSRPAWLLWPGTPADAARLDTETVLDNPLGFAAMTGGALALVDEGERDGLWLAPRDAAPGLPAALAGAWELEVWGAEWTCALSRARGGA